MNRQETLLNSPPDEGIEYAKRLALASLAVLGGLGAVTVGESPVSASSVPTGITRTIPSQNPNDLENQYLRSTPNTAVSATVSHKPHDLLVTVVEGSTEWQIAQKLDIPLRDILEANPTVDPRDLEVGSDLNVPGVQRVVIKSGDTFWGLAKKNGWSVARLEAMNQGINPLDLQVGEAIYTPLAIENRSRAVNLEAASEVIDNNVAQKAIAQADEHEKLTQELQEALDLKKERLAAASQHQQEVLNQAKVIAAQKAIAQADEHEKLTQELQEALDLKKERLAAASQHQQEVLNQAKVIAAQKAIAQAYEHEKLTQELQEALDTKKKSLQHLTQKKDSEDSLGSVGTTAEAKLSPKVSEKDPFTNLNEIFQKIILSNNLSATPDKTNSPLTSAMIIGMDHVHERNNPQTETALVGEVANSNAVSNSANTSELTASSEYQLPETIPSFWRDLINQASLKYDTDPRLLAAILWTENRGFPNPDSSWATSITGAQGPMQFEPATFQEYQQATDNPNASALNPEDAVFAAAWLLSSDGGTRGVPLGNVNYPLAIDTLLRAAACYNEGCAAADVNDPNNYPLSDLNSQTNEYVQLVNAQITSNFTEP